jgi:hypothetical protein
VADQSVLQLTQVNYKTTLVVPVVDPTAPPGLKNVNLPITQFPGAAPVMATDTVPGLVTLDQVDSVASAAAAGAVGTLTTEVATLTTNVTTLQESNVTLTDEYTSLSATVAGLAPTVAANLAVDALEGEATPCMAASNTFTTGPSGGYAIVGVTTIGFVTEVLNRIGNPFFLLPPAGWQIENYGVNQPIEVAAWVSGEGGGYVRIRNESEGVCRVLG